jgi:hypothetical protein
LATERAGMLGSEAVVTGTTVTVSLPARVWQKAG